MASGRTRRVAATIVIPLCTALGAQLARAQGGNIGEGPGWGLLFLEVAAASILVPGLLASVALLLLGRRRSVQRRIWAVVGAFGVPLPAGLISAFVAGVFRSIPLYVLLLLTFEALYVLIFALVWRRRAPA